jgi:hypothetical protein
LRVVEWSHQQIAQRAAHTNATHLFSHTHTHTHCRIT